MIKQLLYLTGVTIRLVIKPVTAARAVEQVGVVALAWALERVTVEVQVVGEQASIITSLVAITRLAII